MCVIKRKEGGNNKWAESSELKIFVYRNEFIQKNGEGEEGVLGTLVKGNGF